jgi:putative endonuclease
MPKESYLIGKTGEARAEKYLVEKGYLIVEKNYRSRRGEIDLIANDGGVLSFIEVKNYSFRSYLSPLESISRYKKLCLIHAAKTFLLRNGLPDQACRFDVLIIFSNENGGQRFLLIKNAFQMASRH